MQQQIPIFGRADTTRLVLRAPGVALTAGDVLQRASALASRLPHAQVIALTCQDRGVFLVALLACWLRHNTVFLPAAHGVDAGAGVNAADAALLLADEAIPDARVPVLRIDSLDSLDISGSSNVAPLQAALPADFKAVILQTSGSTGSPISHSKTWRQLVVGADAMADLLQPPADLLAAGTVSHRHMFGFEALVLQTLRHGSCLWMPRLTYPADVPVFLAASEGALPHWLITTPHHLRVLRDGGLPGRGLDRVVSATMPLDPQLAQSIESACSTTVVEIYGSTETGCIATRRTALDNAWRTGPYTQVSACADGRAVVTAPHIGTQTLGDQVRVVEGGFELLGRDSDLVKVAGKRASLHALTQVLKNLPGVQDASFFDATRFGAVRLAAFVVAPGSRAAELRQALAAQIDPAFLPRPLLFVDSLPRDANGKIARARLQALWEGAQQDNPAGHHGTRGSMSNTQSSAHSSAVNISGNTRSTGWQHVSAAHPALPGHFPGAPIVPGVVLLSEVQQLLADAGQPIAQLTRVKFLQPLLPEAPYQITVSGIDAGRGSFEVNTQNGQADNAVLALVRGNWKAGNTRNDGKAA